MGCSSIGGAVGSDPKGLQVQILPPQLAYTGDVGIGESRTHTGSKSYGCPLPMKYEGAATG